MKPCSLEHARLAQGGRSYYTAPAMSNAPSTPELWGNGSITQATSATYIITGMGSHTVDGPMESVAHCAFTSFRFLWSEIDQRDDIAMFKMEMRSALDAKDPLESLRRTFLEWGHSLDLLEYGEFFTELTQALGPESQEPLPLGF